jgi:hypothetical protein
MYFRPQEDWPRELRVYLRCMRVVSVMIGEEVMKENIRIMDVSSGKHLRVQVVLGLPMLEKMLLPPETCNPEEWSNSISILQKLEWEQKEKLVKGGEHRTNPLLQEYVTGSESLDALKHIPVLPAANAPPYQNLVNSVDSEDLDSVFLELSLLGASPPRMSNILVAGILSNVTPGDSRQYAGNPTRDHWDQEARGVVVEQRVMSILGLAWRRRYYFISYALLKYDQYARSGLLLYLGFEEECRKKATKKSLTSSSLHQSGVHDIIFSFMDSLYPHPFDSEAYPKKPYNGSSLKKFKCHTYASRADLLESVVYDSFQVAEVFKDFQIRVALGGQLTSTGEAFQPYH